MAVNTSNLASALRGSGLTEEQRRLLLLDQIGGPTGTVTAQYGNEAGATFNVTPGNTAGLRAGAVVKDGAGSQWIVGDDYKWAPYTGAAQWQGISAADDARQKLVQDWYNTGMDPANTQALAAATYLGQKGRLGAVQPRAGGPITRDNIDALRAELDASGGGNRVLSADVRAPSSLRPTDGTGSYGGSAANPEYREIKGASPGGTTAHQSYLSAYDGGGVTEPWAGTVPTADPFSYGTSPTYGGSPYDNRRDQLLGQLEGSKFSYDPNTDPVWQAYQKQYRREGQRATEDTLGRTAAMTGGVPSSYAVTAAAQAGNNYAAQLSDRLPQMYQDAYNRYLKEYERQLGLADTYNGLGQQDYNRYRDTLGQYNTDRNFDYGVYSDDYNRARQQYLDRYGEWQDEQNRRTGERSWAYGVEQDALDRALKADQTAYERGRDAIGDWRYDQQYIDSLRQYDDQQLQQQISNAYKFISTFGYVPDWAAEVLGVPAGTSAVELGLGGGGSTRTGGTGGNPGTAPEAAGPEAVTPEQVKSIQNGLAAAQIQNWLHDESQRALDLPAESGNYDSLDYDEDEGIFTWNGKKYSSLGQLAAAINKALSSGKLSAKQEKEIVRKLDAFGFDVSKTSGNGGR